MERKGTHNEIEGERNDDEGDGGCMIMAIHTYHNTMSVDSNSDSPQQTHGHLGLILPTVQVRVCEAHILKGIRDSIQPVWEASRGCAEGRIIKIVALLRAFEKGLIGAAGISRIE